MNPKSLIEVDFQYPTKPEGNILFGAWDAGAKLCTAFWNDGGKFSFILNDGSMASYKSEIACDDQWHTAIIDVPGRGFSLLLDGTPQWSGTIASGKTCQNAAEWPVVVFGACKNADGEGKQMVSAKVFSVKTYEDGELIHDFKPCLKGRDPGFLDQVTGAFKYGQGAKDLVCGGDCHLQAERNDGHFPVIRRSAADFPSANSSIDVAESRRRRTEVLSEEAVQVARIAEAAGRRDLLLRL